MLRRKLGNTGLEVNVLGLGTSELGRDTVSFEDAHRILNEALDHGLDVIDTAECYRNSEEKIGRSVAHRRGEFKLFTKVGHTSGLEGEDWSIPMMEKSIDRSLTRLQTEYVDLLQLHTCSLEQLQQGDVIDLLDRAKAAGKTRFIGYSGDGDAAKWAVESGRFDTVQTSVNIADQANIDEVLDLAIGAGVGIIVKRPIANCAWRSEPDPGAYWREYWERLQSLRYDFLDYGGEGGADIALRFAITHDAVSVAIVGASRPERWSANVRTLDKGPLSAMEYQEIRNRWRTIAPAEWKGLT